MNQDPTVESTADATAGETSEPPAPPAVDLSEAALDFDADGSLRYAIEGELARGGLGRVLIAHDRRLQRSVAIKQILLETPEARRRFVREALVTARLEHPAIVPVHDVGRWPSGELFYCMKRVSGRSLQDVLHGARDLRERLTLVPNLIAVADAVAYAHAHGVLHRDLKPSNILIGDYGETLVIDWGIAKAHWSTDLAVDGVTGVASATAFGAVIGTPAYMPPEQARGAEVDARADVYALGAVLYAMLAGGAPFDGPSADVLERLRTGPPPPLAERAPGAPADLVAIAERAMARDAAQRYRGADELVADLRRFQTGQLVAARSYSVWAVVRRWIARHRALVATAAFATIVLATIGVIALRDVLEARRIAEARSVEAERERGEAVSRAYQLTLSQARSALDSDPTQALAWLKVDPSAPLDWRAAHDVAADALSRGVARRVLATPGANIFAIDPTRRRLAMGNGDGTIDVWNLDDGSHRRLGAHRSAVWSLAFDPETGALYTGSADEARQWTPELDRSTTLARGADLGEAGVAAGRGAFAYVAPRDRVVVIAHGARRELAIGDEAITLAMSANGEVVAAGDRHGNVHAWSVATGEELLRAHNGAGPTEVKLAPDGSALGAIDEDGTCEAWDLRTKIATTVAEKGEFGMVAFSATGRWMACTTRSYVVALDRATGHVRDLGGLHGAAVAFSPDERWLAYTDGNDVELEPLDGGIHVSLRGQTGSLTQLGVTADGASVVSLANDGTTRVWRMPPLPRIAAVGEGEWPLAISPDGTWLAAAGMARDTVLRVDIATLGHRVLGTTAYQPMSIAIAPDGATIATGANDEIRLWDASGGASRVLGRAVGEVVGLAFAPDGGALVSASGDGSVTRWGLGAAGGSTTIATLDAPISIAFSPDGARIACGLHGGAIAIIRSRGGAPPQLLRGHATQVTHVIFARDGRHLASSSVDGSARWWDLAQGTSRVVAQHTAALWGLALSPDDRLLASGGSDRAVKITDLSTGDLRMYRGHADDVSGLVFARDGSWVAAGSLDGTIHFLSLDAPSPPQDPAAFERWLTAQTSMPSPAPAPAP